MKLKYVLMLLVLAVCANLALAAGDYSKWPMGPSDDPGYFPICVWLQSPRNAARYKAAGINTYIGLWRGPTEQQLADLKAAGMKLICSQNATALAHKDDPTIIGWMHGDEPDNAQSLGKGKGYGPPVKPEEIIADYEKIKAADHTRPVLLNLGQGVAWDRWYGRGVRTNHPEDYPQYIKGCDIASFDIYPAVHDNPQIAGNLWFVAQGVKRLVDWSAGQKVVWNCIECTRISNPKRKPTPHEVEAEVWMSIIHGSKGLIYFVHQFAPTFNEAALLSDSQMLEAVTAINTRITRLAPVLNSPTVDDWGSLQCPDNAPTAVMVKRHGGSTYIFAVRMRPVQAKVTFLLNDKPKAIHVLGRPEPIQPTGKGFEDELGPWDVRIYRIDGQ